MRLTLVIPSLERGGAERVMSILAGAWAEQGRLVTLLTLKRGVPDAYDVHPLVTVRNIGLLMEPANRRIVAAFRQIGRVRMLRHAIRESHPDLVISFMERTNVLTLLATRGLNFPVIVSERADPRLYEMGRMWQRLRRLTYPWAAALVCQTSSSLAWFQQRMKVGGYVIPNPVVSSTERAGAGQPSCKNKGFTVLAMGRLSYEKGFDMLLDAFAQVSARYPDWSLTILGDGPLREKLICRAIALNIEGRVTFKGAVSDPFPILRRADLFVLPSRFEGFPNALCEAMACGVAAISFDCPAGPSDIIRDGIDGILVPPEDVAGLVAALDRLMKHPEERIELAARAPEVLNRFSLAKILLLWERLFNEAGPRANE